jgi:hypothetical protein
VSTCRSDRGDLFTTNQSSTWEDKGTFQLPLNPEHYLPFSDTAQFGFDNVTLNWPGYNGMILGHQVVAGYTTDDFYIGALGLSPLSVNITSFNDQYPSFLSNLKEKNHIPSNSYGYTAGAFYRPFPVTASGSLTFGGYDATRMDASNNLTIVGGWDTYRPFLLSIDRITSGSTELLDAPIVTALDSIVSQIWLPISACQHFESVFGLIWNSTYELYLVNETHHSVLLAQNASIKFTLSTGSKQERNNERLDIILPYAAFDLTIKPPYAGLKEVMRYFPLKRAANDTQYTLGRTILQEVYMISDYDRAALSLFPARFPDSSIGSNLIPIQLPGEIPDVTTTEVHSQSVLSRTAIISLAVGAGILLIFSAVVVGIFFRRKRGEKLAMGASSSEGSAELAGNPLYQASDVGGHVAGDVKHELASSGNPRGWTGPQTSPANSPPPQEMPGDLNKSELCGHQQIYEMP